MNNDQLLSIRQRHERANEDAGWEWTPSGFMAHKDRATLLAEVERLRKVNRNLIDAHTKAGDMLSHERVCASTAESRLAELVGRLDWVHNEANALAEDLYRQGDDEYSQRAAQLAGSLFTILADYPQEKPHE